MKKMDFVPYEKRLTTFARDNRHNPMPAELLIWNQMLRARQLCGLKFVRQKPIDVYIVDFYCAELRPVIEIDGDSHAEQIAYDSQRTSRLNALGLTVLRYANREVLQELEGVYEDLCGKNAALRC